MWRELYTVLCGAVRADWKTEKNKQENPVADEHLSPTSNRQPLYDRTKLVKK